MKTRPPGLTIEDADLLCDEISIEDADLPDPE